MRLKNVILAVEDRLSDAVATKILGHFKIKIERKTGYKGNSYLQQKAQSFNEAAHEECGIFMLTDLDSTQNCPPRLIQSWVKGSLNPRFFFRVAVIEVESWVMADRIALAAFLSIPMHRIPISTDNIPNPKEYLISLARRSKNKRLREGLVPPHGTTLSVGDEYNTRLSQFVRDRWNLERAATVSPSLKRTLDRLNQERAAGAEQ